MLYIVSTPIGNPDDISKRALAAIESAELVIGEERKVTTKLLKQYGLTGRPVELLNEHSDDQDLDYLMNECKNKIVALVSDCGTPGFCDPGADLVALCRNNGVQVVPVPGASSLMAFLSVCGVRLDQFLFRGFIPAKMEKRILEYEELKKCNWPFILMDTPYRLEKTLSELDKYFKERSCVLGYRLTFEDEEIVEAKPADLKKQFEGKKGEFLVLVK